MKMVLIKDGIWAVVKEAVPALMEPAEHEMKSEKALSVIILSLENDQLVHVRHCNTGN